MAMRGWSRAAAVLVLGTGGCGVKVQGPTEIPYVEVFETAQFADLDHDYASSLLLLDRGEGDGAELLAGSPSRIDGDGVVFFIDLISLSVTQVLVPWRPIGDVTQHHDEFGTSLAYGDWNGDGRIDVAVGDPAADGVTTDHAGEVWVFFGPIDTSIATRLASSQPSEGARFGETLASGDFDHDGYADLAIGAPHPADLTADADSPSIEVFFGPDFARRERWEAGGAGGQFGAALVALPRTSGGAALVAGAPEWDGNERALGGFFAWERVVGTEARTVAAAEESADGLGRAGACGDFDGDGEDELLVAALSGGSVSLYAPDDFARRRHFALPALLAGRNGAPIAPLPDVSRDSADELLLLSSRSEDPAALLFSPGRGRSHLLLDRPAAAVVAGDLDGDGDIEYLISRPTRLHDGEGGLSDLSVIDFTWEKVSSLGAPRPLPRLIPGMQALNGH